MVDYLLCLQDTERIWQQLSGNTRAGRVGISTKAIAKTMRFSLPIVHKNTDTAPIKNLFSKLSTYFYNLVRPIGNFIGSNLSVITKAFIAVAVVGLVGVGSLQSAQPGSRANAESIGSGIDDLTQKELAVFVADLAGIDGISKQAVPETLEQINYEPQTQNVVKAQVIKTDTETRHDIVNHTVKDGETLQSIAKHYGVSTESIKWASDISSDTVQSGVTLTVPPIDGVIYTVKDGDTAKKLADTYKANASDIIAFNDAEISGLKKGMKIIIPNGEKPAPAPVQTSTSGYASSPSYGSPFSFGSSPLYGGNGYFVGQCTWYVANRRNIPSNWGNAAEWYNAAKASGYSVGTTPKAGAIAWSGHLDANGNAISDGYYGHVSYVEKVEGSQVYVSDYNRGWNQSYSEYSAPASNYLYIY